MAFSTAADHGYNLGAVNTDCPQWEDASQAYVDWTDTTKKTAVKEVGYKYGLLTIAGLCLSLVACLVWCQAGDYRDDVYHLEERHTGEIGVID
jgi:hypothetical protein